MSGTYRLCEKLIRKTLRVAYYKVIQ